VVSEHRSRLFGFRLRPRCPLPRGNRGCHALLNAGQYGEPAPAADKIVCSLHDAGHGDVPNGHLRKWWHGPRKRRTAALAWQTPATPSVPATFVSRPDDSAPTSAVVTVAAAAGDDPDSVAEPEQASLPGASTADDHDDKPCVAVSFSASRSSDKVGGTIASEATSTRC
jgi:hypothetical protein